MREGEREPGCALDKGGAGVTVGGWEEAQLCSVERAAKTFSIQLFLSVVVDTFLSIY